MVLAFVILVCLMPNDFTHQGESTRINGLHFCSTQFPVLSLPRGGGGGMGDGGQPPPIFFRL